MANNLLKNRFFSATFLSLFVAVSTCSPTFGQEQSDVSTKIHKKQKKKDVASNTHKKSLNKGGRNKKGTEGVVTRAAIDLGSGGTKADTMTLNPKEGRLLEQVGKSFNVTVEYSKAMAGSPTGDELPDTIQEEGVTKIHSIVSNIKAQSSPDVPVAGVATEAMRRAKNGCAYLQKVYDQTGVPIKRISQKMEGILGYVAALATPGSNGALAIERSGFAVHKGEDGSRFEHDKIVVWDIGGGSLQLSFFKGVHDQYAQKKTDAHMYDVYEGSVASGTFSAFASVLNGVLSTMRCKDSLPTPNPISRDFGSFLVEQAKKLAVTEVPKTISEAIARAGGQVIGIGSVHNFSVASAIDKVKAKLNKPHSETVGARGFYTVEDLRLVASQLVGKRDEEICEVLDIPVEKKNLASTQLTNVILVYGVMKKAGIKRVWTVNTNTGKGVFLMEDLWKGDKKHQPCEDESHHSPGESSGQDMFPAIDADAAGGKKTSGKKSDAVAKDEELEDEL